MQADGIMNNQKSNRTNCFSSDNNLIQSTQDKPTTSTKTVILPPISSTPSIRRTYDTNQNLNLTSHIPLILGIHTTSFVLANI